MQEPTHHQKLYHPTNKHCTQIYLKPKPNSCTQAGVVIVYKAYYEIHKNAQVQYILKYLSTKKLLLNTLVHQYSIKA